MTAAAAPRLAARPAASAALQPGEWLVQRKPASPAPGDRVLQRACACGGSAGPDGECEECRRKRLQRQESGGGPASGMAPASVHETLRGAGRPLDPATRLAMEERFGHSFAQVRVHDGPRAASGAQAVGARAYTVGRDVVFAAGEYRPRTRPGLRLLAHELAHVVQQGGDRGEGAGAVQPALEVGPAQTPAETEADRAADAVMAGGRASVRRAGGGLLLRRVPWGTCTGRRVPATKMFQWAAAEFEGVLHHANAGVHKGHLIATNTNPFEFLTPATEPEATIVRRMKTGFMTGKGGGQKRRVPGGRGEKAPAPGGSEDEFLEGLFGEGGGEGGMGSLGEIAGSEETSQLVFAFLRPDIIDITARELYDVTTEGQSSGHVAKLTADAALLTRITRFPWTVGPHFNTPLPLTSPLNTTEEICFGVTDFAKRPGVLQYRVVKIPRKRRKKEKEKQKEKQKQKEKGGPSGGRNFGLGIGFGGSGSGNVAVGISVGEGKSFATVSGGVAVGSGGASAATVSGGVAVNAQGVSTLSASGGMVTDSQGATGLSGSLGTAEGVTGGSVATASKGSAKDVTGGAAGVIAEGDVEGVTGGAAGQITQGDAKDQTGVSAGGQDGGVQGEEGGDAGVPGGEQAEGGEPDDAGVSGGGRGRGQRRGGGEGGDGGEGGEGTRGGRRGKREEGEGEGGEGALRGRFRREAEQQAELRQAFEDAARIDAVLRTATPAQLDFLQKVAARQPDGVLRVAGPEWVQGLLDNTARLSADELQRLAAAGWSPAPDATPEELASSMAEALKRAPDTATAPDAAPTDTSTATADTSTTAADTSTTAATSTTAEGGGQNPAAGQKPAAGGDQPGKGKGATSGAKKDQGGAGTGELPGTTPPPGGAVTVRPLSEGEEASKVSSTTVKISAVSREIRQGHAFTQGMVTTITVNFEGIPGFPPTNVKLSVKVVGTDPLAFEVLKEKVLTRTLEDGTELRETIPVGAPIQFPELRPAGAK
ncbi:MAG TPA: DUF4157 domain-containing protein [Longimicrobium sp.]